MPFNKNNNFKYINLILPVLVILLLVGLLLFVINSFQIVSETNKNNFAYTVKTRDAIEEIDSIVERAELNVDVFADNVQNLYDTKKFNDENYNVNFIKSIDVLIKSVLSNSPMANSVWYNPNSALPFSNRVYAYYGINDGKIFDIKEQLAQHNAADRVLTPTEDPYYFDAVNAKKTIWSKIYKDADTFVPTMTMAKPIYKNGLLIGVVGIDVSVENLQLALKNMQKFFVGSEVFLLDSNKNIILFQLSDSDKVDKIDYGFLNKFKNKEQKANDIAGYIDKGIKKTAILLGLSNNQYIVIAFPDMIIYKGFNNLFHTIYFILSVLLALTITIFIYRNRVKNVNKKLENEKNTLRTVIDASQNVLLLKDLNGRYIYCNNKFAEWLGLKKEDIIDKSDADFFCDEELDEIRNNDAFAAENKKMTVTDVSYIDKNGEKVYVEKCTVPLFNVDGELVGIYINNFDITKRKHEQEMLLEAKDVAEKAAIMKSNFLANMSHEIRTPINGVLGFLQLLEDSDPTEEQSEFINYAQKSSELLLYIINDILDFSKIEAGKLKTDNISFDVRSVIEDVVIINASTASKKGIDINYLICSDVPQRVFGDPGRVKQILNNLVSNAIKFTNEGEVVIYVNQVSEDDENNSVLSFKVKDNGIGIPEDKLKLIFDSFTQADASTTRKYGGTGLGLAISQKLADLMNGSISAESTLDEGSTFSLILPFKKDKSPGLQIDNSVNSLNGKNILIINSKHTDLKIIRYYLNEVNCNIIAANSQEEALDILSHKDHNISVVIVDYKPQNTNEMELSRLIKSSEYSKNLPLILFTSLAAKGDAIRVKELGFSGYLTKPLKKHELIESIALAINGQSDNVSEEFITKHLIKEHKFDAKTKILVVEDAELNCKFILKLLNRVGLSCDIAPEGKNAIEAFKTKKYDLILMDCQMPIMDGYEATKTIRELEGMASHTPIIAMTANAMQSDQQKCYDAGMDDYISKPVNTKELLSLIRKYVKLESENSSGINDIPTEIEKINNHSYVENIIEKLITEVGFTHNDALQLFNQFVEFLSQSLPDLEAKLAQNDFANVKQLAHKLKGSSANLRIEKIAQLSAELENESLKENKECCMQVLNQIGSHLEYLNKINADASFK